MKWLWAAHRKEPLKLVTDLFGENPNQEEFAAVLEGLLASNHEIWVMEAPTKRHGRVPVGMAVGKPWIYGTVMVGNMAWFPWASRRNVYESTIKLINELRKDQNIVTTIRQNDKEFGLMIARHGLFRRVGTLVGVLDEPLAVYQSRAD